MTVSFADGWGLAQLVLAAMIFINTMVFVRPRVAEMSKLADQRRRATTTAGQGPSSLVAPLCRVSRGRVAVLRVRFGRDVMRPTRAPAVLRDHGGLTNRTVVERALVESGGAEGRMGACIDSASSHSSQVRSRSTQGGTAINEQHALRPTNRAIVH